MQHEEHVVWISTAAGATLEGTLTIPSAAREVVLFAHGSGSSRHSPRNEYVARTLQNSGFATLLIDLLTSEEEHAERVTRHLRFDIELLAERVIRATYYLRNEARTRGLRIGYFGASTGAAAALVAAARNPDCVGAVVSRGGRPDLAASDLQNVVAPTLLIVGGADEPVLELNRVALQELNCIKHLEIVPGATHLFAESGALDAVTKLATLWFMRYLRTERTRPLSPGVAGEHRRV